MIRKKGKLNWLRNHNGSDLVPKHKLKVKMIPNGRKEALPFMFNGGLTENLKVCTRMTLIYRLSSSEKISLNANL
jgi:hypothetical protein